MNTDYLLYRGKCRELSEKAAINNPSLTVVRGYYICPIWGKQEHWWCKDSKGRIVDPTKEQFPSGGLGNYVEFDGYLECAACGTKITEEEALIESNYAFCSGSCLCKFVGVE